MFVRPVVARAGTPTIAEQTCERAGIGGVPCKRLRSRRLFIDSGDHDSRHHSNADFPSAN
jgi:hypothetical protein